MSDIVQLEESGMTLELEDLGDTVEISLGPSQSVSDPTPEQYQIKLSHDRIRLMLHELESWVGS